ncbi:MAG: 50S ribosomal protein L25/general stress protein Ctc [Rhizomicrobium sp.]
MRETQELRAEPRDGTGKGPAFQIRVKGLVPAVVYGGDIAPENVAVDFRALERHFQTGSFTTQLVMLDIAGKKTRVIPREVQVDPVTDRPVHVDFMRLGEGAKVRLAIPVHFRNQGDSPGLKKGGVLNIVRHEIVLLCPAESIPEEIVIDLSGLDIHDSVHIDDVKLPEGVKPIIRGRDFTICSIVAPTSVLEEQRAAAAAATAAASAPAAEEAAAAPAAGAAPAAAPAKK